MAAQTGDAATAGERPSVAVLRDDLWRVRANFGDAAAVARARTIYSSHSGSPDDQRTALAIVARTADAATFTGLLTQVHAASDPLARNRLLAALAGVADPQLAMRFVDVALSSEAPSGAAPGLLDRAASRNPDAVWDAFTPHLQDGSLSIDKAALPAVISAIAGHSSDLSRISELEAYSNAHIPADSQQVVKAAIASIKANEQFRERTISQITTWILQNPQSSTPQATK